MRDIKDRVKDFILAGYSVKLLVNFVCAWFLLKLNGLVILVLPHIASNNMKLKFHMICLSVLVLIIKNIGLISIGSHTTLARKDVKILLLSWFGMLAISILLGYLSAQLGISLANHPALLSILDHIPVPSFVLYLIAASVIEELVYRDILFGLSQSPALDIVLTSLLFSLHHNPNNFLVLITYFALGVFLGNIRRCSGLIASITLHIIWNMTALIWGVMVLN